MKKPYLSHRNLCRKSWGDCSRRGWVPRKDVNSRHNPFLTLSRSNDSQAAIDRVYGVVHVHGRQFGADPSMLSTA